MLLPIVVYNVFYRNEAEPKVEVGAVHLQHYRIKVSQNNEPIQTTSLYDSLSDYGDASA